MSTLPVDHLWRIAIAVIPIAAAVAVACRVLPCRPSTRHTLWVTVLVILVVAPFLPVAPIPAWTDQLAAAIPPALSRETSPVATADLETPVLPSAAAAAPAHHDTPADVTRTEPVDRAAASAAEAAPAPSPIPGFGPRPRPGNPARASERVAIEPAQPARSPNSTPRLAPREDALAAHAAGSTFAPTPDPNPQPNSEPNPKPAPTPVPTPEARTASASSGLTWSVWLATARDAVMSIPPIPIWLWGGGAAIGLLAALVQVMVLGRLLRVSTPATAETRRLVAEAIQDLGVAKTPRTVMVPGRVSPMVVCGRTPRLLLPEALWRQLDPIGRRAVVYHELAHLKRRDHWVVWLGLVVGCLYWWHPVVWWARRRLREEADLCCDAWVTTLMPTARRAYAVALLETKSFVCRGLTPAPAVGLGVTTLRTKRFARRLTMVMTQHITPRMTLSGLLLVAVTATGGWIVTPSLACPPSKERTHVKVKAPIAVRAPTLAVAPRVPNVSVFTVPRAPEAPFAVTMPSPPSPSTFERYMNLRQHRGDRDDMSIEDRLGALEEHVDALIEHLMEALQEGLPQLQGQWQEMLHEHMGQMAEHFQDAAPHIEDAERAFADALRSSGSGRGAPRADGDDCACIGGAGECDCETTIRAYRLSDGKLTQMTELMVRADVPVLVSPQEDRIEVHGTPAQHRVFGAFVRMIDPKAEKATPTRPRGPRTRSDAREAHPGHEQLATLRDMHRSLTREARDQNRAAEQLMREAERLERRMDQLGDKADEFHDAIDEADGRKRSELISKLERMLSEIRELEAMLVANEAQAETHEATAEAMEEEADELENKIEELEDAVADGGLR